MRTRRFHRAAVWSLTAVACVALCLDRSATAQTFEIVHSFTYGRGEPYGVPFEAADGRILGTTQSGGDFESGSIYALTPDGLDGYDFAELYSFRGPDGSAPVGELHLATNGALYGTTNSGGANGLGTVYRLDANGALTTLHHFSGTDGSNPLGGVAGGPDGSLYGLGNGGGANGFGVFYRIGLDGEFEVRHNFGGPGSSLYPIGELLPANGGFYGVAYAGGASSQGTVFRIELDGTVTLLHEFAGADGMNPVGGLVLDGGKLYGATAGGGDASSGAVFSVDPVSLDFEVVHSLLFAEGTQPLGRLLLADGKLFGTAHDGGANNLGSIFRVDPLSGDCEPVHSFAYGEGAHPKAGLMRSASGEFVGTAFEGTNIGWGTVFRMDSGGTTETLHVFYTRSGLYPQGLLQTDDGLYGTTTGGGNGYGLIFRADADGSIETVRDLVLTEDGGNPSGSLSVDGGFVYGTTTLGGFGGGGTAFRFDSEGTFEKLDDFNDFTEGTAPLGAPVRHSDGNFYGSTLVGGSGSQGILYVMVDGTFDVFRTHSFTGADGANPRGALVEGTDEMLYGTTGASPGTVFRADTAGNVETLHTFDPDAEGSSPPSGLLLAQDGLFYGTLSAGGLGFGSVFRMAADGEPEILRTFDLPVDGGTPAGGLIEDPEGNVLGTTSTGGPHGGGTVFRLAVTGDITQLHAFNFLDGQNPKGELVLDSNGDIFGVTELGGPGHYGVIFRILATPADPQILGLVPSSGRAAGGTSLAVGGAHFPTAVSVTIGGQPAGDLLARDASTILAVSPALSAGTLNDVVLSLPGAAQGGDAVLPGGWFADFGDVPSGSLFHDSVESIFRAGITAGCGTGIYCPSDLVTRAQMAVFLLKAEHGSEYTPPPCAQVFGDVPCPSLYADWIEQLAAEGVTAGCGVGIYCPAEPVTRAQMAVFLLKTLMGSDYVPPTPTGTVFDDVPIGAFAAAFIEDLASRGITGGCSVAPSLYCPTNPNTRGQMAAFLTATFLAP
jgi:uncharacterized repeat protein (TIGR03803 family)